MLGTSFAAARLAKDTSVSDTTEIVVKGTGERVSTTARVVEIDIAMESFNETDVEGGGNSNNMTRLLEQSHVMCRRNANNLGRSRCSVQGIIFVRVNIPTYQQQQKWKTPHI